MADEAVLEQWPLWTRAAIQLQDVN
jgi:hypothetical protein